MRTSGRAALLPKPSLHRTGPGGRKKHIKRGVKGFFLSLSHMCVHSLSLSLSLSLSATPHTMGHSSLASLDRHAPMPRRWIFLLLSKQNKAVTLIYLRAITRSVLRELWPTEGALMSVTPNFCCDGTKKRGAYTRLTKPVNP